MRTLLYLAAMLLLPAGTFAQLLTQSADGKSTILAKGSLISLDVAETDLAFGINNLHNSVGDTSCAIYGGSVRAKNEAGLGNLFSSGDFAPSASLRLYAGWSWSNAVLPNIEERRADLNARRIALEREFLETLQASLLLAVRQNRSALGDALYKQMLDLVQKGDNLMDIVGMAAPAPGDDPRLKDAKARIREVFDKSQAVYMKDGEAINSDNDKIDAVEQGVKYTHGILYGFGGVEAMRFKMFNEVDSLVLSNSFEDQSFQGGHLGVGGNLQWGSLIFGASYSYLSTNTFGLLSSDEYILRETRLSGNQSLIQDKKINAYSGDYAEVEINELNLDFAANIRLDKASKNHVLINPYFRSQLFTRDAAALPNSMNVGCGFYFFRQTGKFLGGFYVELPDLGNNYEKMKPLAEQHLRPPLKRMTFGVVAKFSFRSMQDLF
jgi:hypothetical protein